MSNRYGSRLQSFTARNVAKPSAISPPNDFVLTTANFNTIDQILTPSPQPVNNASNIIVQRVGLFSNFADGLVFKNPADQLPLNVRVGLYRQDDLSGVGNTVTFTRGSKAVTGVGTAFTTDFSPGDIIYHNIGIDINGNKIGWYYGIESVTNDTNMELMDYAYNTEAGADYAKMTSSSAGTQIANQVHIRQLNTFYELDKFYTPQIYGDTTDFNELVIRASISDKTDYYTRADFTFLTKSINTAYDGDTCFFDIRADVEYTAIATARY